MITDPISDMLTRIRNATARGSLTTKIPVSRQTEAIAKLLVKHGWLEAYEVIKPEAAHAYLLVTLKYYQQRPVMRGIKRISKPGQRIYMNKTELGKNLGSNLETVVVTTSHGLMTGTAARSAKLGGEVLFKIW